MAALDGVIRKHPKHSVARDARLAKLETALESARTDRSLVLRLAGDYVKGQPKASRASALHSVARMLLDAGVHLDRAERWAAKAFESYQQKNFYEEMRAQARKAKRPEPSEAELQARFEDVRNAPRETLGLIRLARGQQTGGRRLLEECLKIDLGRSRAAEALAALHDKQGEEQKALEYLYLAQLSGRIRAESRARLERLHRKLHGGSLDGLETALDRVYREKFAPPLHVEPYPAESRSGRAVLAEVFTGAGCPPCAAADIAFDLVMERYRPADVIVAMYHQHIPRPDPMTNPESVARFRWYERGGVPAYAIDGKVDGGGGPRSTAPATYAKVNGAIEKRLAIKPQAALRLEASERNGVVEARIAVESAAPAVKAAKLHVLLAEKQLRYTGENGIRFHPMVVRSHKARPVDLSATWQHSERFDAAELSAQWSAYLDEYQRTGRDEPFEFRAKLHSIDPSQVVVVAFLQDEETKEVLQAAFADPHASR